MNKTNTKYKNCGCTVLKTPLGLLSQKCDECRNDKRRIVFKNLKDTDPTKNRGE